MWCAGGNIANAFLLQWPFLKTRGVRAYLAFGDSTIVSMAVQCKTAIFRCRFGESRLAPSGPEGRTINIEVHAVDLASDRKLWVYDFGGHDTYHFSQQLFLSREAIYIITVDIKLYESRDFDKKIRHWYNMVTSRVVAPILCVLASHVDECENQNEAKRKCKEIEEKLKELEFEELRNIRKQMDHIKGLISKRESKDPVEVFQAKSLEKPRARLEQHLNNRPKVYRTVHAVSALTLEGIPAFKHFLNHMVQENQGCFPVPRFQETASGGGAPQESGARTPLVPRGWVDLGLQISRERTEKPWISLHEFTELALGTHGVRDRREATDALRYLQSLGIVLHYNDHRTKSALDSFVFSSPNLLLAIFGLVYNHNYHQDEIK